MNSFIKKILSLSFAVMLLLGAVPTTKVLADDTGVIKITVTDSSGNSLSGYDFAIRNSSGSRISVDGSYGVYSYSGPYEVISSNGGVIQIHGVPAGSYSVQYIGTDNTISFRDGNFTIYSGQTSFLDMVGTKQTGSVRIKLSGNNGESLSNIHFHITRDGSTVGFVNDGSSYEENRMGGGTITTDSSGNIVISSLSPGNYTLYQDNMPSGYNSSPIQENFYVSVGQTSNLNLTNSKIYSSIRISSVDSNNGKVAATLNIKKDGKLISAFTSDNGVFEYSANAGVEDFNVSEPITIDGLPYGTYTITVKSIDENFSKPADVSVTLDSSQGKSVTLKSEPKGTKLTIRISSEDESIANFPVEILSGSDKLKFSEVSSGVYEYSTASGASTEIKTSSNGNLVVTGIPDGTVKVKTKSMSGYKNKTNEKSVKLKTGTPETVEFEVESADKKTIVLSSASALPYSGATLKITDSANKEVLSQEITDETSIDISSLEDGNYKYTLVNLPDGYVNKEYTGSFKVNNGELPNSPNITLEPMNIKVKVPTEVNEVSLFDNDGNEVQAVVNNGIAEFKDVLDGKYIVKVGDEERIIDVNRNFVDNNMSFVEEVPEDQSNTEPQIGPGTKDDSEPSLFQKYWWLIFIPIIGLLALAILLLANKKKYKQVKVEETADSSSEVDKALDDMITAFPVVEENSTSSEDSVVGDSVVSDASVLAIDADINENPEVEDKKIQRNVEMMVSDIDDNLDDHLAQEEAPEDDINTISFNPEKVVSQIEPDPKQDTPVDDSSIIEDLDFDILEEKPNTSEEAIEKEIPSDDVLDDIVISESKEDLLDTDDQITSASANEENNDIKVDEDLPETSDEIDTSDNIPEELLNMKDSEDNNPLVEENSEIQENDSSVIDPDPSISTAAFMSSIDNLSNELNDVAIEESKESEDVNKSTASDSSNESISEYLSDVINKSSSDSDNSEASLNVQKEDESLLEKAADFADEVKDTIEDKVDNLDDKLSAKLDAVKKALQQTKGDLADEIEQGKELLNEGKEKVNDSLKSSLEKAKEILEESISD